VFSFTQENIDFADDKSHDDLQDVVNAELAGVLQNEKFTMGFLEQLLFTMESWIQPFVELVLSMESMQSFSSLKDAVTYIHEKHNEGCARPYQKLEDYCNMCQVIGSIVGEYDETSQLSVEEVERLQHAFYAETESKDGLCKVVAEHYSYAIFELVYYFVEYFYRNSGREETVEMVLFLADNILFNVLWYLEEDIAGRTEYVDFKEALNRLTELLEV